MQHGRPTTRACEAPQDLSNNLDWHDTFRLDRENSSVGRPDSRIRDNRASTARYISPSEGSDSTAADAQPSAGGASIPLESEATPGNMVAMSNDGDRHLAKRRQHREEGEKRLDDRSQEEQVYPALKADAALVSRGALKSGYLWKLGANVPKWKRRFFVLKPITMLFYYMSEHDTEPRGCIDLDLFDAVRKVRGDDADDSFGTDASNTGFSAAGGGGATNNTARGSGGGGGKRRRASSPRTTFELYRSGCPDGSGFMLEARGDEDWEQWVESIANGRHGKMLSEMEVMKGANKLLLDEINGLERQVATFRGYADQRHVTVLALRDERQRSREVASELATLGDTASALSHLIAESLKGDRRRKGGQAAAAAASAGGMDAHGEAASVADGEGGFFEATVETEGEESPSSPSSTSSLALAGGSADSPPLETAADDGDGGDRQVKHIDHKEPSQQVAEERASLEAVGRALAEARSEIVRRGKALEAETERRRAVEGTVQRAEELARAAEERAAAAEAATARASGRVSVLERNVEYLQRHQRTLRAELCQAREKTQLIRAQKAVLKKEVRDMWTRRASFHAGAGSASLGPRQPQGPRGGRGGGQGAGNQAGGARRRTRTWASMGDLAEADVCPSSDAGGEEAGEGGTGTAAATVSQGSADYAPRGVPGVVSMATVCSDGAGAENEELRQGIYGRQRRGSTMRSRVSRDSLAGASDGGDTDFADRTNSEASDAGDENVRFPSDCSIGAHGSRRNSLFREGVCLSIRKRVGAPQVPSLPPSRHRRTLMAVKNLPLFDNDSNVNASAGVAAAAQQSAPSQQQQQSERFYCGGDENDDVSGAGTGGNGGGSAAVATAATTSGLAVAGMFLGLRKGMVDKAAQEMGKKLSLWPTAGMGGMPSVSSLGSLAAGALSGATGTINSNNNTYSNNKNVISGSGIESSNSVSVDCDLGAGFHPQTPVGSPRSATASFSAALTDSPVRWDPSSHHGSSASTDPGLDAASAAGMPPVEGRGGEMDDTVINPAAAGHADSSPSPAPGVFPAAANPAGGGGLTRVASTSSRTALIQLSDLELAEPCSRRIDGAGGGGGGGGSTSSKRLLSLLPPRPDDEYELLFTTKVIGLQFAQLPDGAGVCVSGTIGYVGPAEANGGRIPGEKICPDIDDVLESYNGVSARGKSAEVVYRELAGCGRPLRLGFRSTRAEFVTDEADQEGGRVVWTAAHENRPPSPQKRAGGGGHGGGGLGSLVGEARGGAGMSSCRDAVAFASTSQPRTIS